MGNNNYEKQRVNEDIILENQDDVKQNISIIRQEAFLEGYRYAIQVLENGLIHDKT